MKKLVFATVAMLACSGFSSAYAQTEIEEGKAVFQRCAICHKVDKGAGNGLGPNLFGVVGRKAAALPDFQYSGPLKSSGITWNKETLAKWIAGPAKLVPGNKMAFPGISSKDQIQDVISYLGSLK